MTGCTYSQHAVARMMTRMQNLDDVTDVELRAETVCVHGDTPGAVQFARALREHLIKEGVEIRAPQ